MAVYGTTDQLRIRIQQLSTPTADQLALMEEVLEGASRAIDRICRRSESGFTSGVAAVQVFSAGGKAYLRIPECVEIWEVAVKASRAATTYTVWTAPTAALAGDGDWIPCTGDPDAPTFNQIPYTLVIIDPNGDYTYFPDGAGAPMVKVTAEWGSTETVPADIREACLMQAARWLKQFQGSMSTDLGSPDLGRIMYRRNLDSAVKQILTDGGWILPLYGGA